MMWFSQLYSLVKILTRTLTGTTVCFSVVEKDGKLQPFPLTKGFWKVSGSRLPLSGGEASKGVWGCEIEGAV